MKPASPRRLALPGVAVLLSLLLVTSCLTRRPSCAEHFAGGQSPVVSSPSLAQKTTVLCFEEYAVAYSGISRTPLWSAEHLTASEVEAASRLKRVNRFHEEERLPPADRSELADYARSGFDRGHMTPSGDMPTEKAQEESFSLANIVPQNPKNNQILWEGIEQATRNLAREDKELYVVTGPIFEGSELTRIHGRVLVPSSIFKAIYDPAKRQAAAYVTPNAPGMEYQVLSIAELERRAKIDVFPKLAADIKSDKMALPVPTPYNRRGGKAQPVEIEQPER